MKKFFLIAAFTGILSSCNNEIDALAEYKDLTIIYALLNPNDTDNYVRVQRGFLTDDDATQFFTIEDSLYYDTADIDVFIREYEEDATDFSLQVELIYDNSIPLEEGEFGTEGHYLYRIPNTISLNSNREYEIVVVRKDGTEAKARTGILGNTEIVRPNENARIFERGLLLCRYSDGTANYEAFQVTINFDYREYNLLTKDSTYKTISINPPQFNAQNDEINYTYSRDDFFTSIKGSMNQDPNIIRFFENLEIEVWGASQELMTYIELNEPNTGINQNRPVFSQVSNGSGIVSSRNRSSINNLALSSDWDLVMDDIMCGMNFAQIRTTDTCICVENTLYCF